MKKGGYVECIVQKSSSTGYPPVAPDIRPVRRLHSIKDGRVEDLQVQVRFCQ